MKYLGYSFTVLLLAFVVFTAGETRSQEQDRRGVDDRRTTYTPQLIIPEESREASRLTGPSEIPAVITPGLVPADRTDRRTHGRSPEYAPDDIHVQSDDSRFPAEMTDRRTKGRSPEYAPDAIRVPSGDSRVIRYDLDDGTYDILELPGPNTGIHRMRVVSDAENFTGAYVYLAYVHENDDGDYLLYFTRSTNSGDTWSTPELIGNVNPSYYNELVDVGLEWRSGTGSRVWLSWVGGPGDDENLVHVRTSVFGTGWSAPAIIDSVDDFSKLGPVVAAFQDNVLIAFQRRYSEAFDDDIIRGIYSNDNGASWTSYFIDSGFSEIRMPWVSNDGMGNFYVTYNDEGDIYARVDDNPNVAASRTLISSGVDADDLMYTAVSGVKGTGNEGASAVWSATVPGEGDLDIYGNFYDPVDEWDDQFSINQWTDIDLTHPHITGDGDGNLYMIHQTEFSPSESDLWMSDDGGETWTWLAWFSDTYRPTVTYANGYLFVAYYQEPEPEPEIVVTPESFDETVEPGGIITRNLTISNVGEGVLEFSLSATEVTPAGYPIQKRPVSAGSASNGTRGANTGSLQTNPWITISPTPLGVSRPAGAVVDGLLYVVGGESTGGDRFGQVQIYDPATDTWDNASAPTMPSPVSNLCAAAIGTSIYVPGGWTGTVTEDALQVFDTATNSWSIVATDPLPAARYGSACASHDGKLYVFGGWDGAAATNTAWVYDPDAAAGTRWSSLPTAPFNGAYGAALSVNNLVFYGGVSDNFANNFDDVAAYNAVGNEWITYPSLQTPRGAAGMWAIGDMLYIGGGGWATFLPSVEAYNTSLGTGGSWEFTNPLNQGRRTFAYATDAVNGHLYAAAGWAGAFLTHAEKSVFTIVPWLSMDPTSGTVEPDGEITIVVTFDATDLEEGTYHAEIIVSSNDPENPVVTVPVTLTVDETVGVTEPDVPTVYSLKQNYPNPFNPSTTIRYGLPERSSVKIEVFNTLGQRVATILNAELEAGFHDVEWYSGRAASGMYFYRLEAVSLDDPSNRFVEVKSMMLVK